MDGRCERKCGRSENEGRDRQVKVEGYCDRILFKFLLFVDLYARLRLTGWNWLFSDWIYDVEGTLGDLLGSVRHQP